MAIDLKSEGLISMAQAAGMLPGRPSLCALWRWRTKGVRGRKLECVILGGKPYTSIEALARFAEHRGGAASSLIRSPRQRDRAIARAEAELHAAGI